MRFHTLQYSNRNRERIVVYSAINQAGVPSLLFGKADEFNFS